MINVKSQFDVKTTSDRFEEILNEKGMIVFNRIKHSRNAEKIGVELRETELIIFGNPKAGSPLIKCQQSIAIDLPQKALIWKDKNSDVWISYNDTAYLKNRHNVKGCEKVISKVGRVLANISSSASSK
ncbi:MAG: DUF302 domain-containing protein [Gammaproteobacteria bacterium]|nr:DUF302 domain-containing protein [Gammaproteobacteria bacterium]MBQ0838489.1 DUF302 domain-containing protein [Gammaproteobacteria bacterium]